MQYDAFCALFMQTYARPEAIAAGHVQYAASITGEILKFYEDYFEINYTQRTLGKMLCMTGPMRTWMYLVITVEISFFYICN